jgi:hypothetical protein
MSSYGFRGKRFGRLKAGGGAIDFEQASKMVLAWAR